MEERTMQESTSDNTSVYLKIIEYKRSIGITQWTVLSIFLTASQAVFVFSFGEREPSQNFIIRVFAVMIYWLGFMLYDRYRALNNQVANYLLELEKENQYKFQQFLNNNFQSKGLSTRKVLILAGCFYIILTVIVSFV
jgi:hypothetical protein